MGSWQVSVAFLTCVLIGYLFSGNHRAPPLPNHGLYLVKFDDSDCSNTECSEEEKCSTVQNWDTSKIAGDTIWVYARDYDCPGHYYIGFVKPSYFKEGVPYALDDATHFRPLLLRRGIIIKARKFFWSI